MTDRPRLPPGLPLGPLSRRAPDGIDRAIAANGVTLEEAEAMMDHGLRMWRIGACLYSHLINPAGDVR